MEPEGSSPYSQVPTLPLPLPRIKDHVTIIKKNQLTLFMEIIAVFVIIIHKAEICKVFFLILKHVDVPVSLCVKDY